MPLRDDLLTPIPGGDPAGPYLRYEPVYDRIKEARRDDPFQDPPVRADWREVAELASEAIAKQSKDLQLAAWLTEAQLQREGAAGLRQGLQLIVDLLDQFWDTVHPIIEDGDADMRAAPLGWVATQLDVPVRLVPVDKQGHTFSEYRESRGVPTEDEASADDEKRGRRESAIADGKLTPEEFDAGFNATPKDWYKALVGDVDGSIELVRKIEQLSDDRMGESSPSFKPIRDALAEVRVGVVAILKRKLELEPDPEDEELDLDSAPGEGDGGDGTVSIEPRSREDAANRIATAARYLRQTRPTDPAAYLLVRGFRWGELRVDGDTPNPRLLAAPPTAIRTRLKGLLLDGRWADLLEAGEDVMATAFGRGWLDLQRYILTACDGLGAEYTTVGNAMRGALRSLLRDIPALVDMTLMDDSPTANAETRGWLRAQGVMPGSGGDDDDAGEAEAPSMAGSALDRTVASLRANQPQRAIEMLMRAAAQEKSERATFLRRADAAAIMVDQKLDAVAMPILQDLAEQIERHQLEDWETSDVVARALGLLYRCMVSQEYDYEARQALYLRVCRLDPLQAMNFVEASEDGQDESGE